jgi:formylglycine-generating enzyme required for sulfatase activity
VECPEGTGTDPPPTAQSRLWKTIEKKEHTMEIIAIVIAITVVLGFLMWRKMAGSSPDTEVVSTESGAHGVVEKGCGEGAERRAGTTMTVKLPGGAKMEMVWCPPGSFMMGSPEDEEGHCSDEPLHQVTLAEGF